MSSLLRPLDRKDLLAAVAFQGDLLALAAALETAQHTGSPSDFTVVTTELHDLEHRAREAAKILGSDSPSAPQ